MHSKNMIDAVADSTGVAKNVIEKVLESFAGHVADALRNGEEARFKGLGIFRAKDRAERQGRNPRNGEPVTIAATRAIKFKAAAEFKRAVQAT